MPEGPEVWILSRAVNAYYENNEKTLSYGKHLFLLDDKENWSFGLTGKVALDEETNSLVKVNDGWLFGEITHYNFFINETAKLGIDFMTAPDADISREVDNWIKSKKKLAGLLLDQSKIAGIGVAWGSEILFHAKLRPDMRACDQNLATLADSILYIRNYVKNIYEKQLKEPNALINGWFLNLYEIRDMKVYKKGSRIEVLGRSWWT